MPLFLQKMIPSEANYWTLNPFDGSPVSIQITKELAFCFGKTGFSPNFASTDPIFMLPCQSSVQYGITIALIHRFTGCYH